jgi:hypothetical protein
MAAWRMEFGLEMIVRIVDGERLTLDDLLKEFTERDERRRSGRDIFGYDQGDVAGQPPTGDEPPQSR